MIRYTLRCDNDHRFDSWFASSDAFETLARARQLECAVCGSRSVEKSLMAPRVATEAAAAEPAAPAPTPAPPLERLRRHVEETATYVGRSFAQEARAQAVGERPDRPIWGEASGAEVRELIRDEVPILPLPFRPKRSLS